jgi:hypothetical protein
MSKPEFQAEPGDNAQEVPLRLLVVQEDERPGVRLHDEEMVMTYPHLMVKELIAVVGLSIFLVGISLLFNAPLEELANPDKTPNPAKAPWYFLGLQELLHYYSPLISGVVLPGAVVGALVVVPYFHINLQREPLYAKGKARRMMGVAIATLLLSTLFYVSAAHPVWSLIAPTLVIGGLMLAPGLFGERGAMLRWMGSRSIAFWIFTWFLLAAVILTVIGVFFRGPGWELTLPWRDGIY